MIHFANMSVKRFDIDCFLKYFFCSFLISSLMTMFLIWSWIMLKRYLRNRSSLPPPYEPRSISVPESEPLTIEDPPSYWQAQQNITRNQNLNYELQMRTLLATGDRHNRSDIWTSQDRRSTSCFAFTQTSNTIRAVCVRRS